jgi:hypothetical protein
LKISAFLFGALIFFVTFFYQEKKVSRGYLNTVKTLRRKYLILLLSSKGCQPYKGCQPCTANYSKSYLKIPSQSYLIENQKSINISPQEMNFSIKEIDILIKEMNFSIKEMNFSPDAITKNLTEMNFVNKEMNFVPDAITK